MGQPTGARGGFVAASRVVSYLRGASSTDFPLAHGQNRQAAIVATALRAGSNGPQARGYSDCRAAFTVFDINIAIVIGPTPPGTGVIAAAFLATSSKATSPTSR